MEIIRFDIHNLPPKKDRLTLVLGTFDGVHLGHQSLFSVARYECEGPVGVLLFSYPWQEVLMPHQKNTFLSSLEDKIRVMNRLGIEVCYIVDATHEFFDLAPDAFVDDVLKPLGTETVVVGEDYTYGKMGKGTPASLSERLKTVVVPLKKANDEKIASRSIKTLLEEGEIETANELLGRPYEITGTIMEGFQNGHKLGFPTANLSLSYLYTLPKNGVYAGIAYVNGLPYKAMINLGTNPTVGKLSSVSVEAHLLDYKGGDLYGCRMYLLFLERERGEMRFESLEKLKEQLQKDERWTRETLAKYE